eukprot:tig00021796_g23559.t1
MQAFVIPAPCAQHVAGPASPAPFRIAQRPAASRLQPARKAIFGSDVAAARELLASVRPAEFQAVRRLAVECRHILSQPLRPRAAGEAAGSEAPAGELRLNSLSPAIPVSLVMAALDSILDVGGSPGFKGAYDVQLLLLFLMSTGLFFFIRASVKDRTEQEVLVTGEKPAEVGRAVSEYMLRKGYRVTDKGEDGVVTFQGLVAPSAGLAVLLSIMAFGGLESLATVIATLKPELGPLPFAIGILAPVAGKFYYERAERPEDFRLQVVPPPAHGPGAAGSSAPRTRVLVKGHSQEIVEFREALGFPEPEPEQAGELYCAKCVGTGLMMCPRCQGTGYVYMGMARRCPVCWGSRFQYCDTCEEADVARAEDLLGKKERAAGITPKRR